MPSPRPATPVARPASPRSWADPDGASKLMTTIATALSDASRHAMTDTVQVLANLAKLSLVNYLSAASFTFV